MRYALLASLLLVLAAGCESALKWIYGPDSCPPEECAAERPAHPHRWRARRVEVREEPEEIVVHAPRQKVVVETPCPAPCPAPCAAAPQQAPPAPQQAPPAPQQAPPVPQPAFTPMAAPGMMPMMALGQQMAAPVNAQVRERTGFALTFGVFRIPIPYPKLITVQRPAEVSFQMPLPQAPAAAPPVMMPMAMAAPMAMPMAAPMAMPMAAPMASYPTANVTMVPQASINYGQVTTQTQVPFQQAAMLQAALSAQGAAGQGAAPAPAAPPPAAPPPSAEQLKQCEQKLKEMQELCERLKKMNAPRMEAIPPPKDMPCAPAH